MARQPNDAPETFARMIARAIRREIGDRRMSDAALARRLGKSNKYVAARLDETFEFSLNDVENFCLYIGINPEDFVGQLDRELEPGDRQTPIIATTKTLGEIISEDDVRRSRDASDEELPILTRDEQEQRRWDLAADARPNRAVDVSAADEDQDPDGAHDDEDTGS